MEGCGVGDRLWNGDPAGKLDAAGAGLRSRRLWRDANKLLLCVMWEGFRGDMLSKDYVISTKNRSETEQTDINSVHEVAPRAQQATSASSNQLQASASATEAAVNGSTSFSSVCVGIDNEAFDGGNELIQSERCVFVGEEDARIASDVNAREGSELCDEKRREARPTHCHVTSPFWSAGSLGCFAGRPNFSPPAFCRAKPLRIKHGDGAKCRPSERLRLRGEQQQRNGTSGGNLSEATTLNPSCGYGGVVGSVPGDEVGHSCTSLVDSQADGILERALQNQFGNLGEHDFTASTLSGTSSFDGHRAKPLCQDTRVPGTGGVRVQRIGVFYSDTDQCGVTVCSSVGGSGGGAGASGQSVEEEKQREDALGESVQRHVELSQCPEGGLELSAPVCQAADVRPAHGGGRDLGPGKGMARGTNGVDSMGQTRQPANSEPPSAVPSATEHRERRSSRGRGGVGGGTDHHQHGSARTSSRHGNERRTNATSPQSGLDGYTNVDLGSPADILPDILNSHLPPPYSTLPPSGDRGGRRLPPPSHPPPPPPLPHNVPPLCGTPGTVLPACPHSTPRRSLRGRAGFRPFPPRDRLRSSGRGATFGGPAASETEEPKHCCGVMVTQTVSIRWFIAMIAFVGLCCAIVGTVLGALKATGREHLTVSLLMIGVGIVLITVSGIAWRLTSHDAPSCRAMLGLQTNAQEPNRRFVPRVPPYGRPHHPYAAMMYPEFQYRPPPPSYQASMQEYRLRLLLLDRQQGAAVTSLSPVSPPPTYRSHTGSTLHSRPPLNLMERDYSRPPSYRSRASSAGVLRPTAEVPHEPEHGASQGETGVPPGSASHSRNPSLSLSFLSHESLFVDSNHSRPTDSANAATSDNTNPVHFTSPSGESQNSVVAGLSDDSPLTGPDQPIDLAPPASWARDNPTSLWGLRKNHDVNAVTIVQTTDSSQVLNRDTVIVAIPSSSTTAAAAQSSRSPEATSTVDHGEVQILAHV